MKYVIRASSFFVKRYLKLTDREVIFYETAALGGKHRFLYTDIDCVLLGPGNILSLQVRNEVFSLPIRPAKHDAAIQALLETLRRYQGAAFPVVTR